MIGHDEGRLRKKPDLRPSWSDLTHGGPATDTKSGVNICMCENMG